MARVELSASDIDLIGRVVDTEVPRSIARRDPQAYRQMVGAVVDTITNRLSSGRYGNTVAEVLNQRRAFSKITGPARLSPYGSVQAAPKASKQVQQIVNEHIGTRANSGMLPAIGGALDYANPHFSDRKNMLGWVNPMIQAGAKKLGIGNAVHYHGLAPGNYPAPPTTLGTPAGFMPQVDPSMSYSARTPTPSPTRASPFRPDELPSRSAPTRKTLNETYAAPLGPVERRPLGPASLAPDRPMPSGPLPGSVQPTPAIDPKVLAAYQEYAQLRGLAPAVPTPTATPRPPDPMLDIPAPPAAPPQVVQPRPIFEMPQPLTDEQFNARAPMPPPSRPADVYAGLADRAQDGMGNTVFSDPRGIGITNRFGATTYSPDGLTTAAGGNFGGLGINGLGGAFEPDERLGGRSPAGNFARQGVGGLGGAAVGGLLGPVGALLGGLVGRELAKPGGGKIGDFVNGIRTVNTFDGPMQFARAVGGGPFPSRPQGGGGGGSNLTREQMDKISPKASRDITRGKTGLF